MYRSYSLHGCIFCLGIDMSASKPSICFWKQAISVTWWNKLLFVTSIWQVIERVHVVYGSWFSRRYEPSPSFGIWGPRVFPRVSATMISKVFCQTGYNSVFLNKKLPLKFTFGQGSCLISGFAKPNSNKAVLVQVFLRFEIVIFNNNFVFCMMISFCSMGRVAAWGEIIKCTNVFHPYV